jgi:hypothetical protein
MTRKKLYYGISILIAIIATCLSFIPDLSALYRVHLKSTREKVMTFSYQLFSVCTRHTETVFGNKIDVVWCESYKEFANAAVLRKYSYNINEEAIRKFAIPFNLAFQVSSCVFFGTLVILFASIVLYLLANRHNIQIEVTDEDNVFKRRVPRLTKDSADVILTRSMIFGCLSSVVFLGILSAAFVGGLKTNTSMNVTVEQEVSHAFVALSVACLTVLMLPFGYYIPETEVESKLEMPYTIQPNLSSSSFITQHFNDSREPLNDPV